MPKYPNRSHPGVAGAKYQLGKAVTYVRAITRQLSRGGEDYAAEVGNKFADEIVRVMEGKPPAPAPALTPDEYADMLREQGVTAVRAADQAAQLRASENARDGAE